MCAYLAMVNINCSPQLYTPWCLGVSAWTTFILSDLFSWWLLVPLTLFCGIPWDMWKQKSYTNVYKYSMVTLLMCRFWHNSVPVGERQRLIFNRRQSPKPYNNGCSYFHYCYLMTHTIVGKDWNWVITANVLQRTRWMFRLSACPYSRYIYCWGLEATLLAVIHRAGIFPFCSNQEQNIKIGICCTQGNYSILLICLCTVITYVVTYISL